MEVQFNKSMEMPMNILFVAFSFLAQSDTTIDNNIKVNVVHAS